MNYPLYTFLTVLAVCGTMLWMQGAEPQLGAVNLISSNATSTLYGGLTLTNGCFYMQGRGCLTASSTLSGYERVSAATTIDTTNNNGTTHSVNCSSGKKVMGGGYQTPGSAYILAYSYPSDEDTWTAQVVCEATVLGTCSAGDLTVYALCATP